MRSKRMHSWPVGAQKYLQETYGFPPYSRKHIATLVRLGKFPPPNIELSERRRGITEDQLDLHAQRVMGDGASGEAA
jgi:hypothetical protein